jgi:hypothetical protein
MLLLTLLFALQAPADMSKGAHLYASCEAAVRLTDNPNSAQAKTELPASTYCFGYLAGYIDGVNRLHSSICVNGASMNAVARVYANYMQRNPKLIDEDRSLGALLALTDAFPCSRPQHK